MREYGVYYITNTQTSRRYIGSTTRSFTERWNHHRSELQRGAHRNGHLQAAWLRYGAEAFEWTALTMAGCGDDVLSIEQRHIDQCRANGEPLYNLGVVAASPMKGQTHSEEARRKISLGLMGHPTSPETRAKMSAIRMGHVNSPEVRRKMALAHTGEKHSEASKEKRRAALKGRPLAPETKRKLSEALKGNCLSPETRMKISAAHRGKSKSAAFVAALSRPYPEFVNGITGETISAGMNPSEMCRRYGLNSGGMHRVAHGQVMTHKGWRLPEGVKPCA